MCICPDRPICASLVGAVLAVAEGERVMVPCRVLADPATTSFRWAFNSSDNNVSGNIRYDDVFCPPVSPPWLAMVCSS